MGQKEYLILSKLRETQLKADIYSKYLDIQNAKYDDTCNSIVRRHEEAFPDIETDDNNRNNRIIQAIFQKAEQDGVENPLYITRDTLNQLSEYNRELVDQMINNMSDNNVRDLIDTEIYDGREL